MFILLPRIVYVHGHFKRTCILLWMECSVNASGILFNFSISLFWGFFGPVTERESPAIIVFVHFSFNSAFASHILKLCRSVYDCYVLVVDCSFYHYLMLFSGSSNSFLLITSIPTSVFWLNFALCILFHHASNLPISLCLWWVSYG